MEKDLEQWKSEQAEHAYPAGQKRFSLAPEVFGVLHCPTGTTYLPNVTCYLFVLSIEQFVCPCASFCRHSWDISKEAYSG